MKEQNAKSKIAPARRDGVQRRCARHRLRLGIYHFRFTIGYFFASFASFVVQILGAFQFTIFDLRLGIGFLRGLRSVKREAKRINSSVLSVFSVAEPAFLRGCGGGKKGGRVEGWKGGRVEGCEGWKGGNFGKR